MPPNAFVARVAALLCLSFAALAACGSSSDEAPDPLDVVSGSDAQTPDALVAMDSVAALDSAPEPEDTFPPDLATDDLATDDLATDDARDIAPLEDVAHDAPETSDVVADVQELPDAPDVVDVEAPPEPWRSALYPSDWTPEHSDPEGRFLHDFSYAGYRGGGVPLGQDLPTLELQLVADPTGEVDATEALQALLDGAAEAGGAIVVVPAGTYRVDGVLTVSGSRVVLRGEGAELSRLVFSRFEGLAYGNHLTFHGNLTTDVEAALVEDAPNRAWAVRVADVSGLAVGDDVQIGWFISEAFVAEHGMSETWKAFNDTWQPFFHRTIVAIDTDVDPPSVQLDVPLRYPALTRDSATLRKVSGYLSECGVEDLGLANAIAYADAWTLNQVHVLGFDRVKDSWIRGVRSFASPLAPSEGLGAGAHVQSSGIIVRNAKRVSVVDSHIGAAQNRGSGGNGYLFELRQSSEVLFADCSAEDGRHNFIQNWGFGATGCVWLRVHSRGSQVWHAQDIPELSVGSVSEFHHSLATANLIDQSLIEDGWSALNRGDYSTGAGHTATQSVFWNTSGDGTLRSRQFGWGYVIGTAPELLVKSGDHPTGAGSEPLDWVEGLGAGSVLDPPSLYEDQLARRLAR